ncbi:hypothetical protein BGX26_009279 [Mortierella sp. AD094]|nr:hypothetical protein BGX26_009279 [Mortierella sp. AD094]
MESTIFDIPLILDEICQYLSYSELATCTLVCKTWSCFVPRLWQTLDLLDHYRCSKIINNLDSLNKHQSHIRHLRLRGQPLLDALAGVGGYDNNPFHIRFENLLSLYWTPIYHFNLRKPGDSDKLLGFIKDHPTLKSICFERDTITPELIALLDKNNLPALKSFSFLGARKVKGSHIQQLIHACAKLTALEVTVDIRRGYVEERDLILLQEREAIMNNMPMTSLRRLKIDLLFVSQESVTLIPLLRKSPLLHELDIYISPGSDMSSSITTLLRDETCFPDLRTLSIRQEGNTDNALAELIRACAVGGNYASSSSPIESGTAHRDVKSLTITWDIFGTLSSHSFVQGYAKDLVTLDLRAPDLLHFSNFEVLVGCLSSLQNLMVRQIHFWPDSRVGKQHHLGDANALMKAFEVPWACQDLKELMFSFTRSNTVYSTVITDCFDSYDFTGWVALRVRCLGRFWERVGEMRNLRELMYDSDCAPLIPLTDDGYGVTYLDRLRGLKNMRSLRLLQDAFIDVKEAEWLIEHWPNLSLIQMPGRVDNENRAAGLEALKAARPWITFV